MGSGYSVAPVFDHEGGESQACSERSGSATGAAAATSAALRRARA